MKLYEEIASRLVAIGNCEKAGNSEWRERHGDVIEKLVRDRLPSGSGFDSGTKFDFNASTPDRLVFNTAFHHMTEGMYDGWTDHDVIVTPSLAFGIELRVTGRDRNDIKDYIAEVFRAVLTAELPEVQAAQAA